MTEKEELQIYRGLLRRISIGLASFNDEIIRESLCKIRNWGYAHSNSSMDMEHDEKCRIDSINQLHESKK